MKTFFLLLALQLAAASAMANDEQDAREKVLRQFFEGRRVTVFVDMPASSKGVDLRIGQPEPLDAGKHARRLVEAGVSVREGTKILVTRVNLKDDLIEFQLGGGGFNSFHDGSGTVSPHYTPKSSVERTLEREVREEKDSSRKRELQRELDQIRREREYHDRESRERAEEINEMRRQRDRERALDMGSRFNIRFQKKDVPEAFKTSEGVMRALEKYVDFLALGPRPPQRPEDLRSEPSGPDAASAPGAPGASGVKKGMTRAEVEEMFGRPLREDTSREGALDVRVASYERGGERFEVTYVDDVVVRVTAQAPR